MRDILGITGRVAATTTLSVFNNLALVLMVAIYLTLAMDPVIRRWDRSPDLGHHRVSFLPYGLRLVRPHHLTANPRRPPSPLPRSAAR
jgi:hypothetical protein